MTRATFGGPNSGPVPGAVVDLLLGGSYLAAADMNGDGLINGLDISPFVTAIVGP